MFILLFNTIWTIVPQLNDSSLEYGYSMQPTANTCMLHKKYKKIHHLQFVILFIYF